jgi:glycosyltransferase involved in cell wall biosynthesis
MVFLGNVDSVPNTDAMNFLVEDILPPLRAERPGATLDVIGPGVTPQVRAKYAGKIEFRGYVPDLGEALSEYDLLIAPLRFGSGTKLKVLDAMANNLPVVTTNVGAEGLSLVHGRDAWIADTVPDIIEGVNRMKSDAEFASQLAANARTLVFERFSWDVIQDRLAHWLSQLTPELAQNAAATPPPVVSSEPQTTHEQPR